MKNIEQVSREYFERFGEMPPMNAFLNLTPLLEEALKRGKKLTQDEIYAYQRKRTWDIDDSRNDLGRGIVEGFSED